MALEDHETPMCVCVCVINSTQSWKSRAGLLIASHYPSGESLEVIKAWSLAEGGHYVLGHEWKRCSLSAHPSLVTGNDWNNTTILYVYVCAPN